MQDLVALPAYPLSVNAEGEPKLFTSLSPVDKQHKKLLVNAMQSGDFRAADLIDQSIKVVHVVVWETTEEDEEEGEMKTFWRTTLIGENNERYSFASDGVVKSLNAIIRSFGPPPWCPPMELKLREAKSRQGRTFHILEVM